jgi:CRISPR-associated protein Cas2
MRNVYLVSYDIADPKRLRLVYRIMQGAGDPLQFSVFRCELTAVERQLLQKALWEVLELAEDRVMLVDLGPAGARGDDCIEFWGHHRSDLPDRTVVVV